MEVLDILSQCHDLGVTLTPSEHWALRVSPPGVLPEELRSQLRTHKASVLQLVTAPPADFVSEDSCLICGSHERWHWLDGRARCRVCLVLDLAPMTLAPVRTRQETRETDPE
jgi:hypothetical protein